jgi:hypothetical protein
MKFVINLFRNVLLIGWLVVALTLFLPAISKAEIEGTPCDPEPTDMNISYGDLITCSIDPVGDSDTFRFFGTVDEVIVLKAARQSGSILPCIELIAPDNSRQIACISSLTNRIDTTLDQTGTFTILLKDVSGVAEGEYALALERLIPHSSNAELIQYGETLVDEINPVGDLDLFFFEGAEGDTVAAIATRQSGSILPCIELIAPDNSRQIACTSSLTNRIDTTLDQTGIFRILYTDVSGVAEGEYALALQCLIGCVVLPPICEGDFDGDHDVDGIDLDVFVEDFGRDNCP